MEDMLRKQANYLPISKPPPSPLSMHKNSQTITKAKPKIRIIHIFAPEIIKTDVANFRELVQRLTGKPTHQDRRQQKKGCKKQKLRNNIPKGVEPRSVVVSSSHDKPVGVVSKKVELRSGFLGLDQTYRERVIKDEEEIMWNGENSGGGFLNGFSDFDGFIQELGEFPFLPTDASHMHAFEETQLA